MGSKNENNENYYETKCSWRSWKEEEANLLTQLAFNDYMKTHGRC